MSTIFVLVVLLLGLVPASVAAQTPDVSGTWKSDTHAGLKWLLNQKNGKLHIRELNGDRVEADFTCPLDGTECPAKVRGHAEKFTVYFDGPVLVEIRQRGEATIKQRLAVSADGKTLTVETESITSGGKPETTLFNRENT
jgi:hypothetical protein